MVNKLITIILFTFISINKAYSLDFHPLIGISSFYTNINDPNFHYTDKFNPIDAATINVGLSLNQNNIILGITTNRLSHHLNNTSQRKVKNNKNGREYQNLTKTQTDSAYIGYQIKRFQPTIFITNANIEKSLYQNDTILSKTRQTAILYGVSLGYFLTKNIEALVIYIAPNKELYLESGFGAGINFIF